MHVYTLCITARGLVTYHYPTSDSRNPSLGNVNLNIVRLEERGGDYYGIEARAGQIKGAIIIIEL